MKLNKDNFKSAEANNNDYERLPNGAYICSIVEAKDVPDKEYLKIDYDICQDDENNKWVGFASKALQNGLQFWMLSTIRSYKDTALNMFKGFCEVLDKSNDTSFTADFENLGEVDEEKMNGLDFGAVVCTEHYWKDNGDEGLRYKVKKVFPVGDFDSYKDKKFDDMYAKDFDKPVATEPKKESTASFN